MESAGCDLQLDRPLTWFGRVIVQLAQALALQLEGDEAQRDGERLVSWNM